MGGLFPTPHPKGMGRERISAKHAETSPLPRTCERRWDEAAVVPPPLKWGGVIPPQNSLWSLNSRGFNCWSPWSPGSVGAWMWLFLLRERHSCQLFLLLFSLTTLLLQACSQDTWRTEWGSPKALKWIKTGQNLNEFQGSLCTQENSLAIYFPAQIMHKCISFWKVKQQEPSLLCPL